MQHNWVKYKFPAFPRATASVLRVPKAMTTAEAKSLYDDIEVLTAKSVEFDLLYSHSNAEYALLFELNDKTKMEYIEGVVIVIWHIEECDELGRPTINGLSVWPVELFDAANKIKIGDE
jgi:hypothetical protein